MGALRVHFIKTLKNKPNWVLRLIPMYYRGYYMGKKYQEWKGTWYKCAVANWRCGWFIVYNEPRIAVVFYEFGKNISVFYSN